MPTAFQPTAFQNNAFQTAATLSANAYSLGALQIAIPALTIKSVLAVNAYSLGSPSFATPTLKNVFVLSAAAYSLGSPSFAAPAITSWTRVIGGDYSLGSPVFATPTLTYKHVLSKPPDYSIGSPVFATPVLTSINTSLPVNSYSLGSLTFGSPFVRFIQKLTPKAPYWIGSPSFAMPQLKGTHKLFTNAYLLQAPSYGTPPVTQIKAFTAPAYSLGGLDIATPAPVLEITTLLIANAYWLKSPSFGFPRLQFQVTQPVWPLTYLGAVQEASAMLRNLLDLLLAAVPPGDTDERATVRRLIQELRGTADTAIRGDTLGTQLQAIYLALDDARATLSGIDAARQYLMTQVASRSVYTQIVFRSALIMMLGLECKIISRLTFQTQDQVQNLITYMQKAFDDARAIGIDEIDVTVYQAIVAMSGTLIDHLSRTQLQLPKKIIYRMQIPMPSLYLANRIYADATRADEIELENGVIHPAFCPVTLRVRSNARYPNS